MEFPHLEKLRKKYGPFDLVVVTINNDPAAENTGALMMSKKHYGFVNLQGPEDWAVKTCGVKGFPSTYVLDQNGMLVFSHLGGGEEEARKLEAELAALVERKGGKDAKQ